MSNHKSTFLIGVCFIFISFTSCKIPSLLQKTESKNVPTGFSTVKDTTNSARIKWKQYFKDDNLVALIDTALQKNQELNILLQEIEIAKNEAMSRKGAYLPKIGLIAGSSVDKVGRYTSQGANDANTEIMPGKEFPEPLSNFITGFGLSWEIDIWKKLRNSRYAALQKYLGSIDGRNFMVTHLISEIANSYYELLALDNQLDVLKKNIDLQKNALEIVRLEKNAARVTELAVKKFEAEVFKNQSRQYIIMQQIVEVENRINFLVGRFPKPVIRNSLAFLSTMPDSVSSGIPSQLLENRPDIRQAERELNAAKLEVRVAKAEFYPSLLIKSGMGYQAFNPKYFLQTPQSLIYSLAGELTVPLLNRKAIKANYFISNAKQTQAAYHYERAILNGFCEVSTQLSNISNLRQNYSEKEKQVEALTQSIDISSLLFKSARADYMEVLMTQRDALEAKFELIETKKQQMLANVYMYRALGGGWK